MLKHHLMCLKFRIIYGHVICHLNPHVAFIIHVCPMSNLRHTLDHVTNIYFEFSGPDPCLCPPFRHLRLGLLTREHIEDFLLHTEVLVILRVHESEHLPIGRFLVTLKFLHLLN